METFSPKDKVVDIIKEYPTTRILFDEVSHFDDTASVEDFCFKNSIDIFSFWNKLSKEMRIQTEDKLRLDSIAEQQMREEKILADRDLERYKRTHSENIAQMVPPYRSVGTARSGSVVPLISV